MKTCLTFLSIIIIIGCSSVPESKIETPENTDIQSIKRKTLLNSTVQIVDTLPQLNKSLKLSKSGKSNSRVLVSMYIASCSPCLVKMKRWKQLISTDSVFSKNLKFVFYAKNDITWYFDHQVNEVNEFPFPIYHDPDDTFARVNNLPELAYVESILLDSGGRIVYSGNPMESEADFNELKDYLSK